MNHKKFKSGYVSIIGIPNAGKSTIMNCICREKLAITTDKPQTTRNRILAVVTSGSSQIIFLDTPGIHRSSKPVNRKIVHTAFETFAESDLVVYVVDASRKIGKDDELIMERMIDTDKKVILVLNKVDLVKNKEELLPFIEKFRNKMEFSDIIPISALKGDNLDELVKTIEKHLPENPPFYPEDFLTDLPVKFFAGEIIREKVFNMTHEEIPYSTAVTIDKFKEKDRSIEIFANINIERDSQKGIIIGKKGVLLKEIGTQSRIDIEEFTGKKVFLNLHVRVHKNWTKKPGAFKEYGIE
ncbi:MAG: GTPase Era [Deltaproteobacteria bacterium]|nr:MAG: GTPase Era [Deltaproteobacteria bacterium]